jgi:hypothetical protein
LIALYAGDVGCFGKWHQVCVGGGGVVGADRVDIGGGW